MFVNIFRKQIYFIVQLFMNLIIFSLEQGKKDKNNFIVMMILK